MMIKPLLRTTVSAVILFILSLSSVKAQNGYGFSHYEIGAATGFNQVYGDAQTKTTTNSVHLNVTYDPTPFVNFVFEVQMGKLAGGDSLKTTTGRQFENDFTGFIFRGQLQMGEIIDYSRSPLMNALKNFYISGGVGYIVNRISQINRYSIMRPGLYTPGVNRSNEPFIPFRVGYEFKVFNKYEQPAFKVDLGYGYNFVLSDNLDGFTSGSHYDAYTQFTVGVKFAFGGDIVSYRKQINY